MRTSGEVRRCWRHVLLIVVYLIAGKALPQSGSAKPATLTPITIAKELDLNIYCGDEVEIFLEAYGARPGTTYKIRKQPLSTILPLEIQSDNQGRGRVLYRHNKKKGAGLDVFHYAAQNPGATMSARAKVQVRSKERPAKLVSDKNVYDFGSVSLGEESIKKIRIRNEGGIRYTKKLSFSAPWHSSRNGQTVGFLPEDEVEIEICFRPEVSGKFAETIYFEKSGLNPIQLEGSGYHPFDVTPKSLNLSVQGDSSSDRVAEFRITNFSDQQINISFECPVEISPASPIILEKKQTKTVTVNANPEAKQGGKYELIIKSGNFTQKIYTLVEPLPPVIEAIPPKEWDLGIKGTKTVPQEFHLQNTGGQRVIVNAIYPSWIKLKMESFDIGVDEKVSVFVEPNPKEKFEKLRDEIIFEYESKKLRVNVQLENPLSTDQSAISPSTIVPTPGSSPIRPQIDIEKWKEYAIHPSKIEATGGKISLEWTYKQMEDPVYLIEYLDQVKSSAQLLEEKIRSLDEQTTGLTLNAIANERIRLLNEHEKAKKSNQVSEVWKLAEDLKLKHDGINQKITVDFNVPKKSGIYTIKITPLQKNGERMPISYKINIPIQTSKVFWDIYKIFLSICIIISILLILFKFRNHLFTINVGSKK